MGYANSSRENTKGWRDTAIEYAERFGWQVVPLSPNPQISEEDAGDQVIKQLGRSPLIDCPSEASDNPEDIRQWTGYPVAALAVCTGARSNLCAIEIGPHAESELGDRQIERFRSSLPDTRCVRGPDREYFLFSLSGVGRERLPLPRFTRVKGIIFHGENSLVRVPAVRSDTGGRAVRWDVQSSDRCASLPDNVLSFFGLEREQGPSGGTMFGNPAGSSDEMAGASSGQSMEASSCLSADDTTTLMDTAPSSSKDGSLSFRSGEQLESSPESLEGARFSWLRNGSLTVLSGPTKTSGTSTFVVNLAAHLASGRTFLGNDLTPTRVVLLSDLPAAQFRAVLDQVGIGEEARGRLHVIHPRDVRDLSWQYVISQTYTFAEENGAGVIIVDSLDQFVELKSGIDPTANADVAHTLTSEAPSDCAILGVKAVSPSAPRRMEETLDRLGLLGKAADVVMQMTEGPPDARRTLRCLEFASRLDAVPSHFYCGEVHGLYQKVPGEPPRVGKYRGDGAPQRVRGRGGIQTHLLNQSGSSDPKPEDERELLQDAPRRPSIGDQKRSEGWSDG